MKFQIKYKGVFNMQALLNAVVDWFEKNGYEHYIYQTKSRTGDFGGEEEFGVKGWFNETDYHRISINVYLHLWDVVPVEIVENGVKKQAVKAALLAVASGNLEKDYAGQFSQSTFTKKLKDFMDEKVINERYDAIWMDTLDYRVKGLGEHIKAFLNMASQGKYY